MSFNAKNLSYDANEPSFLRKLKSEYGGGSSQGQERPSARPRKPKNDEDDDGPTYVDEESNEVVSRAEYEALVRGEADGDPEQKETATKQVGDGSEEMAEASKDEADDLKNKQKVAEIGSSKKRKQAKVVREDEADGENEKTKDRPNGPKKLKVKRKKEVKLSFDDPAEG